MGRTLRYVVISLAVVVLAGIYTWQSLAYWHGYEARLARQQQELVSVKNTALHGKTSAARLAAIRSLDGTVQHRNQLCGATPLFAWQGLVVPPIKKGLATCHDKVASLDKVAAPLHDLRQYLDFTARLEAAVSPLKTPKALMPANWSSKGLQPAQRAAASIKALPAEGDAKLLKDAAMKVADQTVAGWKALIAANQTKDVQKFITASSQLTHAYADFMKLADTADAAIQAKATAVMTATAE